MQNFLEFVLTGQLIDLTIQVVGIHAHMYALKAHSHCKESMSADDSEV